MKLFLKLLTHIFNYWKKVLISVSCNIFSIIFSLFSFTLVIPFLGLLFETHPLITEPPGFSLSFNTLIDYLYYLLSKIIIQYGDEGKLKALFFLCLSIVVIFFLRNLFRYAAMYFMAPVRSGVVAAIRSGLYKKILSLPVLYFNDERKGNLITKLSSDIQEIDYSVMSSLEILFRDPIAVITYFIALMYISPQLTLFSVIILPLAGFVVGKIGKNLKHKSRVQQSYLGHLIAHIEETLSGIRLIQAFNAQSYINIKFDEYNTKYKDIKIRTQQKKDLSAPTSEFMAAITLVVIMWFGGQLVLGGQSDLNADTFIGFVVIFSQIIPPAKSFSTAYINIQKGIASLERIEEVLSVKSFADDKEGNSENISFNHGIVFKDVSFSYGNEKVLHHINFQIEKGQVVALVGLSGSGKTTLAGLLTRYFDPTEGKILLDGKSLSKYNLTGLRGLLGMVTQEPVLFNDTIANNISFGRKTNIKLIEQACVTANAWEFIDKLPGKLNYNIGDKGDKLSGGQKQRLTIARAILNNPPLLILDEATSSLDSESEQLVQDALNKLMNQRTTVVVAHRLSTIQKADKIIVLDRGRIIEAGTHKELLKMNGQYHKMFKIQYGESYS